jgi:hypothetical protein
MLAAIHGLLRGQHERRRRRIANKRAFIRLAWQQLLTAAVWGSILAVYKVKVIFK